MPELKNCNELMEMFEDLLEEIDEFANEYTQLNFNHYMADISPFVTAAVADIKAGKPLDANFFRYFDYGVSDALDHLLDDRLAGHDFKENGEPDFKTWSKRDRKLYNKFDELKAIVKRLIEACKPENEASIVAAKAKKNEEDRARVNKATATRKATKDAENAAAAAILASNLGRGKRGKGASRKNSRNNSRKNRK